MAKQLLIYESAVPVSASRHGKLYFEDVANYSFSAAINAVPLMAVEFIRACYHRLDLPAISMQRHVGAAAIHKTESMENVRTRSLQLEVGGPAE